MKAWLIGGGLSAAASSYELRRHGFSCTTFEKGAAWGGLVRSARLGGVIYEPHGSHIFHTDDEEVWKLVTSLVPFNGYEHRVQTMVRGELLTWPIQEDEVRRVYGDDVSQALRYPKHLPGQFNFDPATLDFEAWCLSIMPREVYDDFVKPYTEKQWGRPANELAASFAPKRVQVRTDGDDRLFKDAFQGFPDAEQGASYETLLRAFFDEDLNHIHTDTYVDLAGLAQLLERYPPSWLPDVVVITVPLDRFADHVFGKLEWRGLTFSHKLLDKEQEQARMVVNWPAKEFPFIRTHETKHASGQVCPKTVLTTEFPGGRERYYPVPGKGKGNRRLNDRYQALIREHLESHGTKVVFTGRLSCFAYYDMDQVIRQSLDHVRQLVEHGEQREIVQAA